MPQRVPIINPSSAVKPIVVSTLWPAQHGAQAGAVAQMGHTVRPGAGAIVLGEPRAMYS